MTRQSRPESKSEAEYEGEAFDPVSSAPEAEGADPTEQLYSAEYLGEVASGDARQERLAELKRRIELGAYRPDADSIAAGMIDRGEIEDLG